ncbi:hypothetical protein ES703_91189 [subsurface metagenome]
MILPQENLNNRNEIIKKLEKLDEECKVNKLKIKITNFYFQNKRYISYIFLLILILAIIPIIIFYILVELIKIPIEIKLTISLFISIFAFIISIITLLINIVTVMDYPIDDLTIKPLRENENLYELQLSIKNCGHGKLKLDFAIYYIESIKADGKFDSFLRCETKEMEPFLGELLKRINKNLIEIYSLKAITKDFGVFFTHDDIHTESRLHKFESNKIYLITFLFLTSHKVFYYISKHLRTL